MPWVDVAIAGTDGPSSEAEAIALAFLQSAGDDRWTALVRLAEEALRAIDHADALGQYRKRLISHGSGCSAA